MLTKFRTEHTECDFKREVEHTKTKSWLKSVSAFANGIGGMYLELIQQNPAITLALLSKKLKVTVKTVQRDLDSLKKSGIIERVGSDREGIWVIRK